MSGRADRHGKGSDRRGRDAKSFGKPVIAFSGCVTKEASTCNAAGIDAFFPIQRGAVSLADAMNKKYAAENLCDTVEQVFRLIRTFSV